MQTPGKLDGKARAVNSPLRYDHNSSSISLGSGGLQSRSAHKQRCCHSAICLSLQTCGTIPAGPTACGRHASQDAGTPSVQTLPCCLAAIPERGLQFSLPQARAERHVRSPPRPPNSPEFLRKTVHLTPLHPSLTFNYD